MKLKKALRISFLILPIPLVFFLFLLKEQIAKYTQTIQECIFHKITGFNCPACGNTRSVFALMDGDIVNSLYFNITPIFLILVILCFYIENVFALFNKKIIVFPRDDKVLYIFTGFFILYYAARNFIPFLKF